MTFVAIQDCNIYITNKNHIGQRAYRHGLFLLGPLY